MITNHDYSLILADSIVAAGMGVRNVVTTIEREVVVLS